jgi:hypothetical protein
MLASLKYIGKYVNMSDIRNTDWALLPTLRPLPPPKKKIKSQSAVGALDIVTSRIRSTQSKTQSNTSHRLTKPIVTESVIAVL